jgi:DNA-directed RNA polymerase sigma subunit (sigma70/sigma32)
VNIAAKKGPEKQEKIGNYFDLTRMRVCQIEKTILNSIKKDNDLNNFT